MTLLLGTPLRLADRPGSTVACGYKWRGRSSHELIQGSGRRSEAAAAPPAWPGQSWPTRFGIFRRPGKPRAAPHEQRLPYPRQPLWLLGVYSFFSSCPPNCLRIAESAFAAKSSRRRETSRECSAEERTRVVTPPAIGATGV